MKVAFCIKYIDGNPRFSDFFGKSDYFFIYDIEKKNLYDKFTNHFKTSPTSEIFCAQILIKRGVNAIVCGKCENDAKNLFTEANIDVIENVVLKPSEFVNILYTKFREGRSVSV